MKLVFVFVAVKALWGVCTCPTMPTSPGDYVWP